MTRTIATLICGLACLTIPLQSQAPDRQTPASSRAIALTFDDLPFVAAGGGYFPAASRTTSELLRVLKAHRAPAIGFVNEAQLDVGKQRREREALLQQWIDAGMTLGNHTYSHPDFNAVTIEEFKDQIVRGEPTITRLMAPHGSGQRFFRHPMTHTGNTREKKDAIDAFLAARGYRIAPHTIENSDFIFNVVYARALAANDRALGSRVRDAYLELTADATAFAERTAPTIFGRDIPQTLLLHANVLNADCLDVLLFWLETRGYRFVSLEEAMNDPAYATKDTMVSAHGPTWLWRWANSLGLKISGQGDPDVPVWVLDAYKR
jgi:peptidoglycan/xylan/chitin deacetylase (PgdA/CDA1 family)